MGVSACWLGLGTLSMRSSVLDAWFFSEHHAHHAPSCLYQDLGITFLSFCCVLVVLVVPWLWYNVVWNSLYGKLPWTHAVAKALKVGQALAICC